MTTIALEGTGTSIWFSRTGFRADLISLQLPERTREAIETTHLASTKTKSFKPGILVDPGQVTVEFDHNPAAVKLINAAPEWITIVYPLVPGQRTSTRIGFNAFCVSEGGEEFTVGSRLTTKMTFQVTSDYSITPGS